MSAQIWAAAGTLDVLILTVSDDDVIFVKLYMSIYFLEECTNNYGLFLFEYEALMNIGKPCKLLFRMTQHPS